MNKLITGKQAQKLRENGYLMEKCETYEAFLHKVAKRLQKALRRDNRACQVSYIIHSQMEYELLKDIVEDYKEVGYDVKLVKFNDEVEPNQHFAIRFLF